jgi:hypothetical protein
MIKFLDSKYKEDSSVLYSFNNLVLLCIKNDNNNYLTYEKIEIFIKNFFYFKQEKYLIKIIILKFNL